METLAKLFGGLARVKIMRLFLLNGGNAFEVEEIASRSRVTKPNTRKEINALSAMGFIRQRTLVREGSRGAKKKVTAWQLNSAFQYLEAVRDLLVDPNLLLQEDLTQRFRQIGKIKLMVVSGVFIGDENSRVDILLVGDKLKKNILQQVIKGLEAEVGKELDYVVFDTTEFKYRLDMYDKLVCDILDLPHQSLIDVGQLSTYISKK
jgi:DNA-binding MarR family transcriptional regulator